MKTLTAYDILNIDGTLYFVCNEFNALVKCENMKQNKLVGYIPEEGLHAKSLVSQIIHRDKQIILIPLNAKKIWIFDLEQRIWKGFEIENSECSYKFMKAVRYENRIYLLPSRYRKMVILDLMTEKIDYIDISKGLPKRKVETYFRNDIVINENIIYAACCSIGYVFKFDMLTEKYEWVEISAESEGFSGMAYDQDKFWILARNDSSKLYCWNGNEVCEELDIGVKNSGLSKGIYINSGKIYIRKEAETIVLDVKNPIKNIKTTVPYIFLKEFHGGCEKLTVDGKYICHGKEETKSIGLQLENIEINKFVEERISDDAFMQYNELIYENQIIDISDFLRLVSKNKQREY